MGDWQFTSYALIYLAAAVISFFFSYKAWRMRPARGSGSFSLLTLSTGIWSLSYLLGFFNTGMGWKLIMLRFEYIGICGAAYYWLVFIIEYINLEKLLNKRNLLLLAVIPVITLALVFTVDWHQMFYTNYYLVDNGDLLVFTKDYGYGFYMWVGYGYFLLFTGAVILFSAMIKMTDRFRSQLFPFAIVVSIITIPNLSYITGSNIIPPYDPTPLTFVLAGMVFMRLMKKYRFLDIVPVAHNVIFDKVNSGIIITDYKDRIIQFNKCAEKLLEAKPEEISGYKIDEKFSWLGKIKGNAEGKREIRNEENGKAFELTISRLQDKAEDYAGSVILLHDISRLKNALDELETYAQTVAHDLKNPLASLQGLANLLLDEDQELTRREKKEFTAMISQISANLIGIVDSLLMLASIRRRKQLEIIKMNMNKAVENSLIRLREIVESSGAEITRTENFPEVYGHPQWIEEVWVNYISNAVKYGGEPPLVELGFYENDEEQIFFVKDNGKGIPPEEHKKLFLEFSRLEQHESMISGQGLGLSIVKRITMRLGGRAGVESEPGKGSRFYFTLPKKT